MGSEGFGLFFGFAETDFADVAEGAGEGDAGVAFDDLLDNRDG